ncbi:MAG: hypothetical protein ACRC2T_11735 [Thermoguttaceae bacterium]
MGIKLNAGITKKIGLPDYGSAGAHCNLELELDLSALDKPLEFHQKVAELYAACRSAVEDELNGHAEQSQRQTSKQSYKPPVKTQHDSTNATSSGQRNYSSPSQKQQDYIRRLATQVKAGGAKLDNLCEKMYQKSFASLTGLEASNLIDTLREVKAGRLELTAL